MNLRKIFLFVSILLSVSCNAHTQVNNTQVNNINENNRNNEAVVQPTPIFAPPLITQDEIASVLGLSNKNFGINGKVMFLEEQPSEIVAFLLKDIGTQDNLKSPATWAKKLKIIAGDRDLNHDGVADKLIVALTDSEGRDRSTKTLHIFSFEKGKWNWLSEDLLIDDIKGTTFIPTGKKNEFDIMKYTSDLYSEEEGKWDQLIGKYESYDRVENGKYKTFKCLEITKKGKKEVPCSFGEK